MTGLFILFIIVVNLSMFLNYKLKKDFGKTIFFTLCILMLFVYVLGLFNLLHYSIILTVIINLIIFILNFIYYKNNLKELKNKFLTPSFLYCIIIFLASYVIFRNNYLNGWDDFSHWGLYVKNIFSNNSIWNNSFTSVPNGYPPIISLFQAFVMKLGGEYRESTLYSVIFIVNSLAFITIMDNLKFKKWIHMFITMAICACFPYVFTIDYFNTIYVDTIIGVLFGAALYELFSKRITLYKLCYISLILFVLMLTKEFGIVLNGIFYIILIADILFIRRREYIQFYKANNKTFQRILLFILFLFPLLARLSWGIYTSFIYKTSSQLDLITSSVGFPAYTKDLIFNYFKNIHKMPIISGGKIVYFSVAYWCVFFILLLLMIKQVSKKENYNITNLAIFTVFASFIVYMMSLLACYLFLFGEYEAIRFASYERYSDSLLIGICMFIFLYQFIIFDEYTEINKNVMTVKNIINIIIILMIGIVPIKYSITSVFTKNIIANNIDFKSKISNISKIQNVVEEKSNIYFISIGNNGYRYWIARYLLTPLRIQDNNWSIGEPSFDEDVWAVNFTLDEWIEKLNKSDYIFLDNIDEAFINKYGTVFDEITSINNNCLYKYNSNLKTATLFKCFN